MAFRTYPIRSPLTGCRRYSRLDDYRTHWNKAHKSQQWVNPQARQRFRCIWQEYCEQRNKCQFSITPSPFLDQAPGLAFPQASSMNITPPSASLPTAVDTLAMPMHLAQAPAQMAPVENDLGLFGQDLFASAAPFSDAKLPFLVLPPSAYNYPPAPFSFPSAFDHAQYSGYTPIDTTLCSRSSSVSASSASTPPAEGIFASDGASYQLHTSLEPFEDLNAGLRPSQADCHMWLADF